MRRGPLRASAPLRIIVYLASLALLTACNAAPPVGVFVCGPNSDCPEHQACVQGVCRLPTALGWGNGSATAAAQASMPAGPDLLAGASNRVSASDVAGAQASPMQPAGSPVQATGGSAGSMLPVVQCPTGACLPGGNCVVMGSDYGCICGMGYSGSGTKQCTPVNDCPAQACQPGGTCLDGDGTYTCTCNSGYSGTGSQTCLNIDDCPAGACQPGGTCVDGINGYSCNCKSGYSGTGTTQCKAINDCPLSACQPGGSCVDGDNDYSCKCDEPDYVGTGTRRCSYHCVQSGGCQVGDRCRDSNDCYTSEDCVNGICLGKCRPNCGNGFRCTSGNECESGYCDGPSHVCDNP